MNFKSILNLFASRCAAFVIWAVLIGLLIAVMRPGLHGTFLFDDNPNIVENKAVHLHSLDIDALQNSLSGPKAGLLGRPVSVITFALTHYFFGLDPFAFKAINLLIHAINGLLVAWLIKLLIQNLRGIQLSENSTKWLPLWAAAIWMLHPINIVAIMMVVQRMTLLSATFMLLALTGHLKGITAQSENAKWIWLTASWLIFWPLSVLSKESGMLFPLYVLVITLLSKQIPGPKLRTPNWTIFASSFSFITIAAAMLYWLGIDWLNDAYAVRPFTLGERLLTETRVLWFYAAQIVIPNPTSFGLYLDDISISKSLFAPVTTLLSVIAWGAVLFAIVTCRHRLPALSFAAAWFLVGHSMESTFLPLEIAHEHRNYLPSIGLIFGLGYFGIKILEKLQTDRRYLIIGMAGASYLLILALFTWMRADLLGKPLAGPLMEAERHPQSARANHAAAIALMRASRGDPDNTFAYQQVTHYLQQTNTADVSFKYGSLTMILWACALNQPVEKQWIDMLAYRLKNTHFGPGEVGLPGEILEPLMQMPKCLDKQDALRLFTAGADNRRLDSQLRARFLEAASDYSLLVQGDFPESHNYLVQAAAMSPQEPALNRKLQNYERVKLQAKTKH